MATISADKVKELRDISGAGMMDCKKALSESDGDIQKAMDFLRKSGIAKAQKKAGREVKDGLVSTYIHPGSKLGVMLEINCETDFVAKTEGFQDLSRDIAMHIAAASPISVSKEDIPSEVLDKEKEIYLEQAKSSGKPEEIAQKMVIGRMDKFCKENALLEQQFVKDPNLTVKEVLTDTIAKLGENISIARFVRFQLGESSSVPSKDSE
tara:strand:+ start:1579 stop:2205 length:627 start_codon:yes stop_codon:yes gene_type:complete